MLLDCKDSMALTVYHYSHPLTEKVDCYLYFITVLNWLFAHCSVQQELGNI